MSTKSITLVGDIFSENKIRVEVINCSKCKKENVLGIMFKCSLHKEWSLCFKCLEEAKKQLEAS